MNTSKLNYLLAFVLVALFSFTAQAQDYTFKVVSKKGSAVVNGEELKIGSKIQGGAKIVVGDGALLNIAHNNGKSVNISKPGSYSVDDLAKGCSSQANSLTSKYADFVLKELTSGDNGGVGAKNMKKPGSVTRAVTGADVSPLDIMSAEVKSKSIPGQPITLRCFVNDGEKVLEKLDESEIKSYTFVISDFGGKVRETIETKEPSVTIDINSEKYQGLMGNAIKYYVYANNDPKKASVEYVIEVMTPAKSASIREDVAMLSEDNSALGKLILARYFEDQGLYANAMYAYEEAVKMSEEDEQYKSMYQAFLDRNYLSKKGKKEAAAAAKTAN